MNKPCVWFCKTAACAVGAIWLSASAIAEDSLWTTETKGPISDKRASRLGDLLTIVVQQNTSATKDNTTKTSKTSGVDASVSSFLFSPGASSLATKGGKLPAMKFDGKNEFNGGGSINNSEKMTDRVTVRVVDTQPNGNLVIEGTRQTSFGGEVQDVILRGVVRAEDVSANNTVFSYNVADATIRMVSKGAVSDSQKKGWGTKVWDKVSPF